MSIVRYCAIDRLILMFRNSLILVLSFPSLKKLLIIEDDINTPTLMGYIFERSEFDIVESRKPIPIPEIVILNPNIAVIDCFLDDVQSGDEMCVKMKSNPFTKNIPVILLSSSPNLKTIAQHCGADAYITKPFDLDHFVKWQKSWPFLALSN